MIAVKQEIEQRKMEARMLILAGDWRGLQDVLAELRPLFVLDHSTASEFYREMVMYQSATDALALVRGRREE